MISHTRVKTPTAAAEFLINHVRQTAQELEAYEEVIYQEVPRLLQQKTTAGVICNPDSGAGADAVAAGKLPSGEISEPDENGLAVALVAGKLPLAVDAPITFCFAEPCTA